MGNPIRADRARRPNHGKETGAGRRRDDRAPGADGTPRPGAGRRAEPHGQGPHRGNRDPRVPALGQLVLACGAGIRRGRVLHLRDRAEPRHRRDRALHDAYHRDTSLISRSLQWVGAPRLGERHRAVRERRRYDHDARVPASRGMGLRPRQRAGCRDLLHPAHAEGLGPDPVRRPVAPRRRLRVRHLHADRESGPHAEVRDRSDGRTRHEARPSRRAVAVRRPAFPPRASRGRSAARRSPGSPDAAAAGARSRARGPRARRGRACWPSRRRSA